MVQQLRVLVAFAEDQSLVLSTCTGWPNHPELRLQEIQPPVPSGL